MSQDRIALRDHLLPSQVIDLDQRTRDDAIAALVEVAAQSPHVEDPQALLHAVLERERLLSTGIGFGLAIPHARIAAVREFVVAVGRHRRGLDFGSIDGKPVHIIVLITGPQDAKKPYLELLAQISKRLKIPAVRQQVLEATDPSHVVTLLVESR